ncbi:hypothetical protein EDB19DRAFT_2034422 [Suillus lakei]|nr:hypothetical protein EDB19DRAFT_2034422 [Suillus lakei]
MTVIRVDIGTSQRLARIPSPPATGLGNALRSSSLSTRFINCTFLTLVISSVENRKPIPKPTITSQVHRVAPRLLDFPVEILLDILGHLDVYELVRACQIYNDVRQVISSSELLYSMDLEYFNAIPVPSMLGSDCSIPTLRKSLLQSESAWKKAEYLTRNLIAIPYSPSMYRWSRGVLGFPVEALQQIMFFQPQLTDNHSDATNLFKHSNFPPAQDLVVLLARAPPGESHVYDIIFKSLSEDKVYSDAAFIVVKALDNGVDWESLNPYTLKSSIFGDYYGILFRNVNKADGGAADFLQIRNRKPKDTFQNDEIKFPDERRDSRRQRKGTITILPRSFRQCPPAYRQILVQIPFEYKSIAFSPILFHTHTHNQIIAINVVVSGEPLTDKSPCLTLYVEHNSPLGTRVYLYDSAMEKQESSYDPCKHSIFGFRVPTVSLVGDGTSQPDPRPLCIRNFNSHRVVDFKAWNGTRWNQRLIEGETPSSSLFLEPLGSGLSYLETITQEKFLATDMSMHGSKQGNIAIARSCEHNYDAACR